MLTAVSSWSWLSMRLGSSSGRGDGCCDPTLPPDGAPAFNRAVAGSHDNGSPDMSTEHSHCEQTELADRREHRVRFRAFQAGQHLKAKAVSVALQPPTDRGITLAG